MLQAMAVETVGNIPAINIVVTDIREPEFIHLLFKFFLPECGIVVLRAIKHNVDDLQLKTDQASDPGKVMNGPQIALIQVTGKGDLF